jgi:hypothetical protein
MRMLERLARWVLVAGVAGALVPVAAAEGLGLTVNLDGDNAFAGETLEASRALLRAEVDAYADAGVETLVYSVGAGSDVMLYPTAVGVTWGWRPTPYDTDPRWADRIARNRANQEAGGDGPRTAGERARERGLKFFPSLRMNDAHYVFGKPPEDYPLTGRFYLENRGLVIGTSPIPDKPQYGQLLDYTHEKVRAYRLAQCMEVIDRYGDLMTGFEMDFTRFQVFFPPGTAAARGHLITEMVRKVRGRLDEAGAHHGRRFQLIVRVPPSPENCAWAGLEVERWVEEGLVDALVPSQMMTAAFDLPVDRFRRLTADRSVGVYATLLPRVGWRWPLDVEAAPEQPTRDVTAPQWRALAANLRHLGADGLYLFNIHTNPQVVSGDYRLVALLGRPDATPPGPMTFTVTKAYWEDDEDTYQYRKQLPAALRVDRPETVELYVGLDEASLSGSADVTLRLGLRDASPDAALRVRLNGQPVMEGTVDTVTAITAQGERTAAGKRHRDLATTVAAVAVEASWLRPGRNIVEITTSAPAAILTDTELTLTPRPPADHGRPGSKPSPTLGAAACLYDS